MVNIRVAKTKDWREILKFLRETPELQGSGRKVDPEYTKDYVVDSINNKNENIVLVAEEDKIIGLLTAEIFKKKRFSYLTDFAIKQEYRKKGIGKSLYQEFEKMLKKNKIITVAGITKTSNKAMHKLLKSQRIDIGEKFYFFVKSLR